MKFSEETRLFRNLFSSRTDIDLHTRPSVHSNQSTVIELGMSLIEVRKLDESSDLLDSLIWVRVVWYDYSMHWSEDDYGGISVIRAPPDLVWKPTIVVHNNIEPGNSYFGGNPYNVLIYPNGQILWVPSRHVRTTCAVDLRNFPFDVHECSYRFTTWAHDGHMLKIKLYGDSNTIDVSDYWEARDWIMVDSKSYIEEHKEGFVAVFSATLKRRCNYYVFSLIIPAIVVWVLLLFSFWVPPASNHRLIVSLFTAILLVLLLLHIHNIVPRNGSSVPRIVIFCGLSLVFSILSLLFSVISVTLSRHDDADSSTTQAIPDFLKYLITGKMASIFLCLEQSNLRMSVGAKLLSSSNMEVTVNENETKEEGEGEESAAAVAPSGGKSVTYKALSEWTLVAQAINRIGFIIFCLSFVGLAAIIHAD